ncbi:MAG: hypothetical protein ACXVA9_10150, partial [Bdellovibrionales bacterium]
MHNYFIFDPFLRGSDPWGAVLDQLQKIGDLIADHALSFSTETFGMFWNSPPEGWIWYIFQLQKIVFVAALASAAYVFVTKTDIQRRKSIGFFFTAAVVAILLHSLMMSLTSMTFGPYYYAGQISLLMVITFALAIDRIQPWLAVTAVTLCTVTTAYAFPFTNQAMKHFHHYPRGNPDFQKMFQGDLNRFTLKSPVFDNLQILLTMRDLKMGECTDVPNELVWYMTSLGYRIDTDFPYQTAVVKLCRESTAGAIVN